MLATWVVYASQNCVACRHCILLVLFSHTEGICLPRMEEPDDDTLAGKLQKLLSC